MKFILKALDTFELDSDAIIMEYFDTLDDAIIGLDKYNKKKSESLGTTFYKYFLEDEKGNRIIIRRNKDNVKNDQD